MHNWVEEYDLHCAPDYKIGLIGSLFFTAVVISSLIFPRLADIYGRKYVFLFGLILHAVACFIFMFSKSIEFTYAISFIVGASTPPRAYVGYVYFMEFMPKK